MENQELNHLINRVDEKFGTKAEKLSYLSISAAQTVLDQHLWLAGLYLEAAKVIKGRD